VRNRGSPSCVASTWLIACWSSGAQSRLAELRCEYLAEPLGIDVPAPRFSWVIESAGRGIRQTAYEILVAGAPEKLTREQADQWRSGKVASARSVNVPYAGKPLASGTQYFWKVRIWDQAGRVSPWSRLARFQTGLLRASDWKARWIGDPDPNDRAPFGDPDPNDRAPLLRKPFRVNGRVRSAFAYVSGLGYYELYLNGRKVGDHVLDPAPTQYEKRVPAGRQRRGHDARRGAGGQ